MDALNNVIGMIMGITERVFGWIDNIMMAFVEGENRYIIYVVFIYILGVFGMAKVNLKIDTKRK